VQGKGPAVPGGRRPPPPSGGRPPKAAGAAGNGPGRESPGKEEQP